MMKNTLDDTIYYYDLEDSHLIVADGTIEGTDKDELFNVQMTRDGYAYISKDNGFELFLDSIMDADCKIRGFEWF